MTFPTGRDVAGGASFPRGVTKTIDASGSVHRRGHIIPMLRMGFT
jgi:hypothetical protein